MKRHSLSALVAAGLLAGGLLSTTSANAADLGGNCCADLEERIAELEATTARKGNRKVSLTVSGWVAEQVTWWDDGSESNVYVQGIGQTLASNFKFTGQATITPGWSAGYVLQIEAIDQDPLVFDNQNNDDGNPRMNVLQSYWFIKSDSLGKIGVGKQSQASDNAAILVDGSGSLVPANWVMFEGAGFFLKSGGAVIGPGYLTGITGAPAVWGDIGYCYSISTGIGGDCNGQTLNVVRYDSPTFGGFSISASWGEDDMWDVAGRFAGEFGGFKLAAAVAYSVVTDNSLNVNRGDIGKDIGYFQAGVYIQHVPTGLFIYGAYGQEDVKDSGFGPAITALADPGANWYLKAGIRQRWTPLGHTVLYGFYQQADDQMSPDLLALGATGSELKKFGGGIVQEIDAAAMSLWLKYQRMEGEISGGGATLDLDELDMVTFGALINF